MQLELNSLENNRYVDEKTASELFFFRTQPVYFFHAAIAKVLGEKPLDLVPAATLISSVIFLVAIYFFSIWLIISKKISLIAKVVTAILSSFLIFLSFGTATFSFVRYYAYFPTIFSFPLFFLSVAIFTDYLQQPRAGLIRLLPIPLFLFVMAIVHSQETLFTVIILAGISLLRMARTSVPLSPIPDCLVHRNRVAGLTVITLAAIFIVYTLVYKDMRQWGHTPHVVDAGNFIGLLMGFPIANPSFRFWDTLGFFGIIVYIFYFINLKHFARNDFLFVGMLSPIFTHFNPLYATLFLHYGSSTILWRTAYLMPLAIVAAHLIVFSIFFAVKYKNVIKLTSAVGLLFLVMASLLPFESTDYPNRTSRIPSLRSVSENSGDMLWKDLIIAVDEISKNQNIRRILSDEVTSFVLHASTTGKMGLWKEHEYFPKHLNDYQNDFLNSDMTDTLLVINRRDGRITSSAVMSGHWPAELLKISQHYPDDLDSFISTYPNHFNLLWKANKIEIYSLTLFRK